MRAKDVGAYVVAGLLVLATLPIYRYIIQHARADVAREQAATFESRPPATQMVLTRQPAAIPDAMRSTLVDPPAGVRCYGESAILVKGNAYTQAVGPDGRPLRCAAGKVLLPAQ